MIQAVLTKQTYGPAGLSGSWTIVTEPNLGVCIYFGNEPLEVGSLVVLELIGRAGKRGTTTDWYKLCTDTN